MNTQIKITNPNWTQKPIDQQMANDQLNDDNIFTAVIVQETDFEEVEVFNGMFKATGLGSTIDEVVTSLTDNSYNDLDEETENLIYQYLAKNPTIQKEYIAQLLVGDEASEEEYEKAFADIEAYWNGGEIDAETADKIKNALKELDNATPEALRSMLGDISTFEDIQIDSIEILSALNDAVKTYRDIDDNDPDDNDIIEPTLNDEGAPIITLNSDDINGWASLSTFIAQEGYGFGDDYAYGFKNKAQLYLALHSIHNNPANAQIFEGVEFDGTDPLQIAQVLMNRMKENGGTLDIALDKLDLDGLNYDNLSIAPKLYTSAAVDNGYGAIVDDSLDGANSTQLRQQDRAREQEMGNAIYLLGDPDPIYRKEDPEDSGSPGGPPKPTPPGTCPPPEENHTGEGSNGTTGQGDSYQGDCNSSGDQNTGSGASNAGGQSATFEASRLKQFFEQFLRNA